MRPLHRRHFLVVVMAAAASPGATFAQQVHRIGFLGNSSPPLESALSDALRQGMRELGYSERNLQIEFRWAEGKNERLPALASELAAAKASVIVTGGTPGTMAARRAAGGIPIVMVGVGDPVGAGLVDSLAKPGGTVTGIATLARDLEGKRLELLTQVLPKVRLLGVLMNPGNPFTALALAEMKRAAEGLGISLVPVEIRSTDQIEPGIAVLRAAPADAVILIADRFLLANRSQITEQVNKNRLPGIFPFGEFVQEGGLMSYAPDYPEMYRRAAAFVDQILKGMRPGDLPVEQPTKFELVINAQTANLLGIKVPQDLLLRAHRVIH